MDRVQVWLEYFEARSLRERSLIFAASLVLLLSFIYLLWFSPQLDARQHWLHKLSDTDQKLQQMTQQAAKLEASLALDPDREIRARLLQLQAKSARLDDNLRQAQADMISPETMPKVLQDMLRDIPLVLLSLRKIPAEVEIDSGVDGVPIVYRHGLRLEFEGSYSDTLDYIERLERLPWGLAWEVLDIQMRQYPRANIILRLYTLSFEEEWLGV